MWHLDSTSRRMKCLVSVAATKSGKIKTEWGPLVWGTLNYRLIEQLIISVGAW